MEKKISQRVADVKKNYPDASVEVWAEDEHRIGLNPVNRMIWVQRGENPVASVNWKYKWLWLVGFVHPNSGQTYWWIVPFLNHLIFTKVLKDFAQHFGLGAKRRVVLALDQARFHTSEKVEVPEGIELLWMPPKSPELQPAERLWPLTDEPIANRAFENLDQLEQVIVERCQILLKRPQWIRGYTQYHWWPSDRL